MREIGFVLEVSRFELGLLHSGVSSREVRFNLHVANTSQAEKARTLKCLLPLQAYFLTQNHSEALERDVTSLGLDIDVLSY